MFIITRNSQIHSILPTRDLVLARLGMIENEVAAEFHAAAGWNQTYYRCAANYAANHMRHVRVLHISDSSESLMNMSWIPYIGNTYRGAVPTPDDVLEVTGQFFSVVEARYEADAKVFATVVKSGLKSTGMEVILDPSYNSNDLRPVSYYEDLVGTFARVKATTNIHGYGYATLFFSPEALGNIRVETQTIDGFRVNW